MFGSERSRPFIEQIYVNSGKSMEVTLELFLSGNVPDEKEELRVIIEDSK